MHYDLRQPMAHTAGKLPGAPEIAVAFWNQVAAWCAKFNQGRSRAFDQVLPSLRHIRSDSDGLTDSVAMTIGMRLPLNLDPHNLAETTRAWAGEANLTFTGHEHAFRAEKNTPLVRGLVQAIRAVGGTPAFKDKTGTSDMNVVGPVWRCPIVAYGPGDSALDHTPDEHLVLAEYLQAIRVLTLTLNLLEAR
jgi:LysW-gamma-L-lysine carboxypeptidase